MVKKKARRKTVKRKTVKRKAKAVRRRKSTTAKRRKTTKKKTTKRVTKKKAKKSTSKHQREYNYRTTQDGRVKKTGGRPCSVCHVSHSPGQHQHHGPDARKRVTGQQTTGRNQRFHKRFN
jgi:hypothetical protein